MNETYVCQKLEVDEKDFMLSYVSILNRGRTCTIDWPCGNAASVIFSTMLFFLLAIFHWK